MNNIQSFSFKLLLALRQRRNEEGYSLVVVLASIILLGTLLVTTALVSKVDTSSTNASESSNSGFYAAEAGLGLRAAEIRKKFEGFNRPNDGDNDPNTSNFARTWEECVDNDSNNDGGGDFVCDTSLTINGQQIVTYVEDKTGEVPESITIADGRFKGLNAQEYRYDVYSTALKAEGSQQSPSSILGLRFKNRLIPLFQFAIFYENDLDFTIPPNMTLNGRLHSNHDIYLNSASSSFNLTINGGITTAGILYRGDKSNVGSQQCSGNVRIMRESGSLQDLLCNGNQITPYASDSTSPSNISDWGSSIYIGADDNIEPLTVPPPDEFNPSAGGKYWDVADLRIVLKLGKTVGSSTYNQPIGIEIQNADGSQNTTATTKLLTSCPVVEKTLQNEADGSSQYEDSDTTLRLNNTTSLSAGDVVTVGNDLDSNVISSIDPTTNNIQLKRKLGHAYQGSTIANANEKVRKAVVSTSDTFYNYREKHVVPDGSDDGVRGKYIRMLNVDVQALIDCVHNQSLMGTKTLGDETDGGLVWFFTVDGPESNINFLDDSRSDYDNTLKTVPQNADSKVVGSTYGIRLYNGQHLYSKLAGAPIPKGLSIASDQAVYIKGNYNLNRDEFNTTVDFDGSGTVDDNDKNTWIPAAIFADTINVLSNAWKMDDSNGRTYVNNIPSDTIDYNLRVPTTTNINAAFLSGTEISGETNGIASALGGGSGGVNNYPRFHEGWEGTVAFNYRGSFVSLNEPRKINSPFCGSRDSSKCNIYSPPIRNWDFDTRFLDAANLPPMTPRAIYLSQELFERDFTYTSFKPNTFSIASLFSDWHPSTSLAMRTNNAYFSTRFTL